jgi:hypothetical protein
MTRWRVSVFTILLVGVACASTLTITGSPNVVTTAVPVSGFSSIEVGSAFKANVTLGDREELTIRVNDNLVDRLDVGVSSGTLRIGLKSGGSVRDVTLEADVTAMSLVGIQITGAAQVHMTNELSGQSLRLGVSGAGQFDGAVRLDQASLDLSGASRVSLTGSLDAMTLVASGASQLKGEQLQVADLTIELSGASITAVSVTDTISARLSGASILRYGGTPRFTGKDVSGASIIEQL